MTEEEPPEQIDGLTIQRELKGQTGEIKGLAWSPDGSILVTSGSDRTIRLWDWQTGRCIRVINAQVAGSRLSWSPNGDAFAICSLNREICIFSRTGQLLRTFAPHPSNVFEVAWSPNGQFIASGTSDGVVCLWNTQGQLLNQERVHRLSVDCLRWQPGTKVLASGGDGSIHLLDYGTGKIYGPTLTSNDGEITGAIFDGRTRPPRSQLSIEGATSLHAMAWSPNGQMIVSCHDDRTLKIWDIKTGRRIKDLQGHTERVTCVAYSYDGQLLLSRDHSGVIIFWTHVKEEFWDSVAVKLDEAFPLPHPTNSPLTFHPSLPVFATLKEKDTVVVIGQVDRDQMFPIAQQVKNRPSQNLPSIPLKNQRAMLGVPLSTDPIVTFSTSDQPTEHDELGFAPCVNALADFLTDSRTNPPLTVSIEGNWGSGKSSFMKQLQHELRARHQTLIIEFNAWRHDKDEAMWASFASGFVDDLAKQIPRSQRWISHLKLLQLRFNWKTGIPDAIRAGLLLLILLCMTGIIFTPAGFAWLKELVEKKDSAAEAWLTSILAIGGGAGYLTLLLSLWIKAYQFVSKPLKIDLKKHINSPDYDKKISFIENFHDDFEKIVEAYAGQKTVYVFVDDLDRCEPLKAAELIQAINLMISDSTHLVFILGLDRGKVAASLAVKYEKIIPYLNPQKDVNGNAGLEYGFNFIEKFVQVPFRVPQANPESVEVFLNDLCAPKTTLQKVEVSKRFLERGSTSEIPNPEVKIANVRQLPREFSSGMSTQIDQISIFPDRTLGYLLSDTIEEKEKKKELRRAVEDSQTIRDVAVLMAPSLGNNPRRIKQLVNVFRLRAYICINVGLLIPAFNDQINTLSLEKLGKFVALSLGWPLFIVSVERTPRLLEVVQRFALGLVPEEEIENEDVKYWCRKDDLLVCLRTGINQDVDSDEAARADKYYLTEDDVRKLMQVSRSTSQSLPS